MEKKANIHVLFPPSPSFKSVLSEAHWSSEEQAGHGVSSKRNLSRWDSIPPQGLRFFHFVNML